MAFFNFSPENSNHGIAIGSGGAITTIVDNINLAQGLIRSSFSLNDNGAVAFTDGVKTQAKTVVESASFMRQ